MQSPSPSPALAGAAGLLSAEAGKRTRRLAYLLRPVRRQLENDYLALLTRRGFGPRERKALAAITVASAGKLLAAGKSFRDFFEQVEYSGRRLAKLEVSPAAVLKALAAFDLLLTRAVRQIRPEYVEDARWVAGQLNFCAIITLNNSFYQVREAETEAFFELHDAELHAASGGQLVEQYSTILARFVGADAVCAVVPEADETPAALPVTALTEPKVLRPAARRSELLDASWRRRYRSVWSIPLGGGVVQFGFTKKYEWLPRELRLLTGASARCRNALEKIRLTEQLALRERQVRELAVRMLDAEERERRRIRRELHDETAQILPYLLLRLEMVERAAPEASDVVKSGLTEARQLIGQTVVEIRRVLSDLSPAVLEQLGLAAAVRHLLSTLREKTGIRVRLDAPHLGGVPKTTEVAAYRIVQECCNNVARHSSASRLNVSLSTADGSLKMSLDDDGVGFRVEEALAKAGSYGLVGMRERVALAGGRLGIESAPGRGTRVSVEIPIRAKDAPERLRRRPSEKAERRARRVS